MKIVVAGYIVGYPLGGMTWHHLNYLLGLAELGHEVTYLEDGADMPPYDPTTESNGVAAYGVDYLKRTLENYGYGNIAFHYRFGPVVEGVTVAEINRRLKSADLLICVSGVTPLDWYERPSRTLIIDTDPVFTQLRMVHDESFRNYYKSFTHAATFGRLIGTPASQLPTHDMDWIPTCQPIMQRYWPLLPSRPGLFVDDRAFTTLGKWEHAASRTVTFNGREYASTKAVEWMKLMSLPSRSPWPLRIAMDKMLPPVQMQFEDAGWLIDDAVRASKDPAAFRQFIAESAGELTVAKQIYTELPSGWFSDRSAAYLMTGRPVITQSSGYERWLPTGEGLFCFKTIDEAVAALETTRHDHERHCAAARQIAEEFFDSRRVLQSLLDRVMG
ncbi:MAG TPA: glycosyltransferase [Tepidisphaeraceae bacterium]|nr:glycosyltransferase [Tepidisphaeraceae bacterium]